MMSEAVEACVLASAETQSSMAPTPPYAAKL